MPETHCKLSEVREFFFVQGYAEAWARSLIDLYREEVVTGSGTYRKGVGKVLWFFTQRRYVEMVKPGSFVFFLIPQGTKELGVKLKRGVIGGGIVEKYLPKHVVAGYWQYPRDIVQKLGYGVLIDVCLVAPSIAKASLEMAGAEPTLENLRKYVLKWNLNEVVDVVERFRDSAQRVSEFRAREVIAELEKRGFIDPLKLYVVRAMHAGVAPETQITPVADIHYVLAHLVAGKNLLLYGPPGTGKTRLALKLYEVGKSLGLVDRIEIVTANASWSHADIVGGYVLKGSTVCFEKGVFLRAITRGSKPWIIIDEINRCNIDVVLGPVFTLLDVEYRYIEPLVTADKARNFCDGAVDSDIHMPYSLRVIATMNAFDRAILFSLGFALLRRFACVEVLARARKVIAPQVEKPVLELLRSAVESVSEAEASGYLLDAKRIFELRKGDDSPVPNEEIRKLAMEELKKLGVEDVNVGGVSASFPQFFEAVTRVVEDLLDIDLGRAHVIESLRYVAACRALAKVVGRRLDIRKVVDNAVSAYLMPQLDAISSQVKTERVIGAKRVSQSLEKLYTLLVAIGMVSSARRVWKLLQTGTVF